MNKIYLVVNYYYDGTMTIDNAFESKADAEKRCKELNYEGADILSVQFFKKEVTK